VLGDRCPEKGCVATFAPVVASDGQVFLNSCVAACYGASVVRGGKWLVTRRCQARVLRDSYTHQHQHKRLRAGKAPDKHSKCLLWTCMPHCDIVLFYFLRCVSSSCPGTVLMWFATALRVC
jgi:hypothetical protein